MKQLWNFIGRIAFWLSWPALWLYLRGSQRVRVAVENPQGEMLVVKGWLGRQKWSLPGGGMHEHEDPRKAAVREVAEETAVTLRADRLQETYHGIIRGEGFLVYTRLYRATCEEVELRCQAFEIIDAVWLNPDVLNKKNAGPDVLIALGKRP